MTAALAALVLALSARGRVVDDRGVPIAKAEVRWADAKRGSVGAGSGGIYATDRVYTDADGRFVLDELPPKVVIEVQAEGHMFSPTFWLPTVKLPEKIVLERMQRVKGRLLLDGKPPEHAILLQGHGHGTDAEGRFDFVMTLNLREVDVAGEGFVSFTLPVTGKAGEVHDFGDVVLHRGALLTLVLPGPRDGGEPEVITAGEAERRQGLAREQTEAWRVASFTWDPTRRTGTKHLLVPGRYVVWAEPDVPNTEVTVGDRAMTFELTPVVPAMLEVEDPVKVRESKKLSPLGGEIVLDCGGRYVRVHLRDGRAELPVAPGKCWLPVPETRPEGGKRDVELISGKRTKVKLVDSKR